jgi:hypothetical protein
VYPVLCGVRLSYGAFRGMRDVTRHVTHKTHSTQWQLCVTSGFRRDVNEVFILLGCDAAMIGRYLPTIRKKTYLSHLQGPSSSETSVSKSQ